MKKLIILIALLFPVKAFSQKQDSILFRKAQKVILKTNRTSAENFAMTGKALVQSNFMISSKDKQFGQIISEPIKIKWGQQVIYVIVKDNEVVLSSKFKSDSKIQMASWIKSEPTYNPVAYSKNGETENICFANMIAVAKLIGLGKIIYSE
ncbi:MAG: hypothetical protein ABIN91_10930 [Mucilaginibacter sp.]|uniref:hypothetical protein n=1 Tax=Mucilaginibacter sp. TaxID=1882438 RepID=UPI0032679CA2